MLDLAISGNDGSSNWTEVWADGILKATVEQAKRRGQAAHLIQDSSHRNGNAQAVCGAGTWAEEVLPEPRHSTINLDSNQTMLTQRKIPVNIWRR